MPAENSFQTTSETRAATIAKAQADRSTHEGQAATERASMHRTEHHDDTQRSPASPDFTIRAPSGRITLST